jgi:3D (Asp-Asp-Asp) domain-containing protein
MGYGSSSSAFAIIPATNPDTPLAPVTEFNGDYVVVSWELPFNGGSSINGYTIKVRQVDEITYTSTGSYCDGTTLTVINTRTCQVPISVITASPFDLPWGTSVWATVKAINIIGDS